MSIMHKNTNILFAVSASILIHTTLGLLFILGLPSDLRLLPSLNKANSIWVSLESVSGKTTTSPVAKRTDRKQSSDVATLTGVISNVNATKNISVNSYSAKENGSTEATAGHSSAFATASPLYRENNPPVYPVLAKLRGYEGVVLVYAEILPDGRVGSTEVSKSSGYTILDKSAIEAVKLWKFEPAKKAGKPFAVRVKLPIKFVLHDDDNSRS